MVQHASELVDIANWKRDEDFDIFPVGSKPKRAVFCPTPAPCAFLIAGHRYMFKVSKGWQIYQHWSEVIDTPSHGLRRCKRHPASLRLTVAPAK